MLFRKNLCIIWLMSSPFCLVLFEIWQSSVHIWTVVYKIGLFWLDSTICVSFIGFSVVESWPDATKKLGQLSAVSFDVNGNIVVFHRGDRVWDGNTFLTNHVYNQHALGPISQPAVVVFSVSSGLVLDEWGSNMWVLPQHWHSTLNGSDLLTCSVNTSWLFYRYES